MHLAAKPDGKRNIGKQIIIYSKLIGGRFHFSSLHFTLLSLKRISILQLMITNIWDGFNKMQMNFQMYPLQEQFNRVTSI